jgi:hypothetical protein
VDSDSASLGSNPSPPTNLFPLKIKELAEAPSRGYLAVLQFAASGFTVVCSLFTPSSLAMAERARRFWSADWV